MEVVFLNRNRILLLLLTLLVLTGCGGKADIPISPMESERFTEEDYLSAAEVVKKQMSSREFNESADITPLAIRYAGDEKTEAEQDYICTFGDYDEGIVLLSDFQVGESTGPWEPNHTYRNWQWFLARKDGGRWVIVTSGYG